MRLTIAVFLASIFAIAAQAQTVPTLKVLPWDNHTAAVSLTFDDARPCQLDIAVPELEKRGMHGTFYLLISKLSRFKDWEKAAENGEEIGSHTMTHQHPTLLDAENAEEQIEDSVHFLSDNLGLRPFTFAYPYGETTPGLDGWVKSFHFAARAGWSDNFYVVPADNTDFYSIPSQVTMTATTLDTYKSWVDTDLTKSAWTVFQIHGIGDEKSGWEPIPVETFTGMLDYMKAQEDKGLWVAPFGTVASYLKAQEEFEHARQGTDTHGVTYSWEVPPAFPDGVTLRITALEGVNLFQQGVKLEAEDGVYNVAFDARALTVVPR